MLGTFSF